MYFHPSMLVWKGLGNLETALYLVWFRLWWFSHNFLSPPKSLTSITQPRYGKGCRVPPGRSNGLFPCVTVKGRGTEYLWVSRNFAFLWCLSNGSSHVYHSPQIRQFSTPPLHSLLSELWSLVFLLKTTSTNTPFAYNPPFISYAYIVVSSLSPTSHFPSEP